MTNRTTLDESANGLVLFQQSDRRRSCFAGMKFSLSSHLIASIAVLVATTPGRALAGHVVQQVKFKTFELDIDPEFKDYLSVAARYIDAQHARRPSHVCVVGIDNEPDHMAWMIWREGRKIVLWEPGENDLALSRRTIDLTKDVVHSNADLHGSTYRVTDAWVNALNAACERHGHRFTT